MSKSSYDFTLYGPDTENSTARRRNWSASSRACRGCRTSSSDLQIKNPRVNIVLDRDRAAALDLNWSNISSALYDAFGPQFASTIYAPTNQYRVLLEMLPQYQQHTDGLDMIYLKSRHRPAGAAERGGAS